MSRTMRTVSWAVLVSVGVLGWPAEAQAAKKVLRLRLDGPVMEAPSDAAGILALFQKKETHTLRELVKTIGRAGGDKEIAALVVIIEQPEMGLAQAEELTAAFKVFKAKGKPVYCYMDDASNLTYVLAAAADHITLAENSELDLVGLRGAMMFFKGLFDKLGIEADLMHCGAYKSALEPFTRTEPSPEAAENINWLLDSLYDRWIGMIAEGRKLSPEDVKKAVDVGPLTAAAALERKLIDDVSSFPAFKQRIQKEFGKDVEILKKYEEGAGAEVDMENPFALFQFFMQMMQGKPEVTEPGLGLIYVDGGIVVGPSEEGGFGGGKTAGSTTVRAALEKAREDDTIKAVVLRVDSPGGSALASDIIWKAAAGLAAEKPLIVSMGSVAGSGGYYVSLPGDPILAEPSTITASIGVVGGKIVWKGLLDDKLGITTTEFTRGKHAGLMSGNRKWNEDERAWMTGYMNSVYEQFKGRVMKSRGNRLQKELEQMAGGRVYTGEQALKLGLVDKLGGLADALELATNKAGLKRDCPVYVLPKPSDLEAILALFRKLSGKGGEDEFEIGKPAATLSSDPLWRAALPLVRALAPEQFRGALDALRNLVILERERVGCFMPFVPQVR